MQTQGLLWGFVVWVLLCVFVYFEWWVFDAWNKMFGAVVKARRVWEIIFIVM